MTLPGKSAWRQEPLSTCLFAGKHGTWELNLFADYQANSADRLRIFLNPDYFS